MKLSRNSTGNDPLSGRRADCVSESQGFQQGLLGLEPIDLRSVALNVPQSVSRIDNEGCFPKQPGTVQ